ncbi:MAG: hypothetical protein IPJ88_13800 [Myxococcales bacterium]|nr:MAG: hypothetical protein IPJ88_13800 [Myxococcales bacterium]
MSVSDSQQSQTHSAVSQARKVRITQELSFALSSLLVLAIVVALNYLSFRHYTRWDWTKEQLYSLSSRSEKKCLRAE